MKQALCTAEHVLRFEFQTHRDLVDAAFYSSLKNETNQELLDLVGVDVQLLEGTAYQTLFRLGDITLHTLAKNVSSKRV